MQCSNFTQCVKLKSPLLLNLTNIKLMGSFQETIVTLQDIG